MQFTLNGRATMIPQCRYFSMLAVIGCIAAMLHPTLPATAQSDANPSHEDNAAEIADAIKGLASDKFQERQASQRFLAAAGGRAIEEPGLRIPHPRLGRRAFLLDLCRAAGAPEAWLRQAAA